MLELFLNTVMYNNEIFFGVFLTFFPKQALLVCQYKEFHVPDLGIHKYCKKTKG